LCRQGKTVQVILDNGDTLLISSIDEVFIYPEPVFTSRRDYRRYQRLIYNLKIVYPYAKLASKKLEEMNTISDH
jgi:alpha-N-acetylglucosamine transferase